MKRDTGEKESNPKQLKIYSSDLPRALQQFASHYSLGTHHSLHNNKHHECPNPSSFQEVGLAQKQSPTCVVREHLPIITRYC